MYVTDLHIFTIYILHLLPRILLSREFFNKKEQFMRDQGIWGFEGGKGRNIALIGHFFFYTFHKKYLSKKYKKDLRMGEGEKQKNV